jgi:hypothetical protein
LVDENTTFSQFIDNTFAPWDDPEIIKKFEDLAMISGSYEHLGYCLNEKMELISVSHQFPFIVHRITVYND